jgi:hypothetical protein
MVRSLERRLERLLEGIAGKVFSGRLHPSEIAGKVAREADLARFAHDTGPATANVYDILVNPRDLTVDPEELERTLEEEIRRYTVEEGLRLEGPISVSIEAGDEVAAGSVNCHVEVRPGPPVPWARLQSEEGNHEIGRTRALVGRSPEADVILTQEAVSRSHALIWRQGGQVWIRDLGSSNGTAVDGLPVGDEASSLQHGSVVTFADRRFRFMEI